MNNNNTLIIIGVLGVVAYFLYRSGFFASLSTNVAGDKYTQYAAAAQGLANNATGNLQGLANNATGNFLSVHNGISQGINDQINRSVETGIGAISQWAQQRQDNKNRNDQREADQFLSILQTI